jgi:hypothetical protein
MRMILDDHIPVASDPGKGRRAGQNAFATPILSAEPQICEPDPADLGAILKLGAQIFGIDCGDHLHRGLF